MCVICISENMQKLNYLSQFDIGLSSEIQETLTDETILNAKHLYNEISVLCDSSITRSAVKYMALIIHQLRTVLPADYYDLNTVATTIASMDQDAFAAFLGYELPFIHFLPPDTDSGVYIKESFKQFVPHGTELTVNALVYPADGGTDFDAGNVSINTNVVMGVLP